MGANAPPAPQLRPPDAAAAAPFSALLATAAAALT